MRYLLVGLELFETFSYTGNLVTASKTKMSKQGIPIISDPKSYFFKGGETVITQIKLELTAHSRSRKTSSER